MGWSLSWSWLVAVNLIVVCGGWLHPRALIVHGWGVVHMGLREVLVVWAFVWVVGVRVVWVVGVRVGGGHLHGVGVPLGGGCSCGVGVSLGGGRSLGWWAFM